MPPKFNVQSQQSRNLTNVWNLFKVNNKVTDKNYSPHLTHERPLLPLKGNQSIYLIHKLIDWFFPRGALVANELIQISDKFFIADFYYIHWMRQKSNSEVMLTSLSNFFFFVPACNVSISDSILSTYIWKINKILRHKKRCFEKYCSCDKACQFSALQGKLFSFNPLVPDVL